MNICKNCKYISAWQNFIDEDYGSFSGHLCFANSSTDCVTGKIILSKCHLKNKNGDCKDYVAGIGGAETNIGWFPEKEEYKTFWEKIFRPIN